MRYKIHYLILLGILIILGTLFSGCAANDPWTDSFYTSASLNPSANNTGSVGTASLYWANGYFTNINGVPYPPGIAPAHNILSVTHTDSLPASVVRGDLIVGNATPKWSRLPAGGIGDFLRSNGTDTNWSNLLLENNDPMQWKDVGGVPRDVFNLFNWLDILPNQSFDAIWWLSSGTGRTMYLWGSSATAVSTTKNSPTIDLLATHWNGVSTNREAKIVHSMITAGVAPKSRLNFSIDGSNIAYLENDNGTLSTVLNGTLNVNTHFLTNVIDPINPQDAATKNYVDTAPASSATTVAITDDVATNATMYPTWVTANAGNLPIKVSSTKLSYNPSFSSLGIGHVPAYNIGIWQSFFPKAIADNANYVGGYFYDFGGKTSAIYTGQFIAVAGDSRLDATNTQNWTNTVGIVGVEGLITTVLGSTGTVTGAAAFKALGTVVDAASVTNYYGYYSANPTVTNNKLTNAYSFYSESITGGSTLNYAFYSVGGQHYFGGNVGIGSNTIPSVLLHQSADVATVGTTTQDTTHRLQANYWSGAASTAWNYDILHDMTATTPASTVYHSINAVNILSLTNTNTVPTLNLYGDTTVTANKKVYASSGVIGFSVVSTALTLGSAGSIILPDANMSGAANDAARDVLAGNVNGAIAVDGSDSSLWLRLSGAWKHVHVAAP